MTFWNTATTEQKLAQIDGAIECGLTQGQCATNLGTTLNAIGDFSIRNGRKFSKGNGVQRRNRSPAIFDVAQTKERDAFASLLDEA